MDPEPLPAPRTPPAASHGCDACRGSPRLEHFGSQVVPEPFVPLADARGEALPGWTRSFHVCGRCGAFWSLFFDPKEMMYSTTPAPEGMARALRSDATLDDLLPFLFAERLFANLAAEGIRRHETPPSERLARLLELMRHPECPADRRVELVGLIGGLLQDNRPVRGFEAGALESLLPEAPDRFLAELERLEALVLEGAPGALRNPTAARTTLERVRSVLARFEPEAEPPPPVPPTPGTDSVARSAGDRLRDPEGPERTPPIDRARPALAHAVVRMLGLLLAWHRFLPGILVGLLLVEPARRGDAPGASLLLAALLFGGELVLAGSALAVNAGVPGGFARIAWRRLSVLGEYGYLALALLVPGVLGATAGEYYGDGASASWFLLGAAVPLLRLWPTLVVPYMQSPHDDHRSIHVPGVTRRMGLATAWALTGRRGVFRSRTISWFAAAGATVLAIRAVDAAAGGAVAVLVVHAIALPALLAFTWGLVETLEDVP